MISAAPRASAAAALVARFALRKSRLARSARSWRSSSVASPSRPHATTPSTSRSSIHASVGLSMPSPGQAMPVSGTRPSAASGWYTISAPSTHVTTRRVRCAAEPCANRSPAIHHSAATNPSRSASTAATPSTPRSRRISTGA